MTLDAAPDARSVSRTGVERIFAEAGWGEVEDRLLSGACHDLNGRVSALSALYHLLRMSDGGTQWAAEHVGEEVGRLDRAVALVRLLPGDPAAAPQPLDPSELLPSLLALYRKHPALQGTHTDFEAVVPPPALMVNRTRFTRVLLIVLVQAGCRARSVGGSVRAVLAAGREGAFELVVDVLPPGPAEGVGDGGAARVRGCVDPGMAPPTWLVALAEAMAWDGGSCDSAAAPDRVVVRYPALAP